MEPIAITRDLVPENKRIAITAKLFGVYFPLQLEPYIYQLTSNLAKDYHGGFWDFYTLSNGGFYMAPSSDQIFKIETVNGFVGSLAADDLGITVCLYAYSHLSFSDTNWFANVCGNQYHLLRDYMLSQVNASSILRAID